MNIPASIFLILTIACGLVWVFGFIRLWMAFSQSPPPETRLTKKALLPAIAFFFGVIFLVLFLVF